MSSSRALAIIGPGKDKPKAEDAKAEKITPPTEKITPPVEVLHIHAALLLAAESTAAKDEVIAAVNGVHLHMQDKMGRVVATDGKRVFVASFAVDSPVPSWMRKGGITLSVVGLRKRVQLIMAMQDSAMIRLSHTKGSGFIEMSDAEGDAVFKIGRVAYDFPDYQKLIGPDTFFAAMDEDGNVKGNDWEPVGINSQYLKHCGEIAKTLENGLPKKDRSKTGMIVRAFNATPMAPLIFDFSTWPGAILIIMPARLASPKIAPATAAMIGPVMNQSVKLTLAALRAHATRQLAWAEAATDPAAKAEHERKAAGFVERVAAILTRTGEMAITADPAPKPADKPASAESTPDPTPQATPESTPEPTAAAPEPAANDPVAEPANRPATKRTKIKIPKKAA